MTAGEPESRGSRLKSNRKTESMAGITGLEEKSGMQLPASVGDTLFFDVDAFRARMSKHLDPANPITAFF